MGGCLNARSPPWNYQLTFNIEGLTNEYYGGMTVLRDGKLAHIPCFTEMEMLDVPPLGQLECFFIAGGASTAPWTFAGHLQTYQLKVLRYPGNFAQLKAFSDLGLFATTPIKVDGKDVVPRHVFHALFEPQVRADVIKDMCIIRVRAVGKKDGAPCEAVVEMLDYYDEQTAFSAMQRTTGWRASMVAAMMARREIAAGSLPVELAVPGEGFVREAKKRGLQISVELAEGARAPEAVLQK
jgi:lysine 6-dehydrogenase